MFTLVTGKYAALYPWDIVYPAYRKAEKGKRCRIAAVCFEYPPEYNLSNFRATLAAERE